MVTPTLAETEHGGLSGDGGDVQTIEGLSLRIASLVSEAKLKDDRLKELESDLNTKCSEYLQVQQHVTLLLNKAEAKDARLEELQTRLNTQHSEYIQEQQKMALLLREAGVKDARIEGLGSNVDASHGKDSKAQQQIASLADEARAKSTKVNELESNVDAQERELSKTQQQVALLLDKAKAKDTKIEELESALDAKDKKHSQTQQKVASLLDEAKAKSTRIKELESDLSAKCSEHSQAQQQIASLLNEARDKDVRAEELESRLASERSERLTVQQLYASLRKTIRVMVRIRPSLPGAKDDGGAAGWSTASGSGVLEIAASATQSKALNCRFDRVFRPQASNNDVFDETLPLVRLAATEGARCVIIAYGASSTGKSYTMRGDDKASPPTPGIIQLAGCRIFDMVSAGVTVEVSSMYVYNRQVWDLLVADKDRNLVIPVTQKASTPATKYEQVRSPDELVGRFDSTMLKTVKAATRLNAESSRGHYFFTVRVNNQPGDAGTGLLTFVDLAGNESVKESGVEGEQFKESQSINNDLFALGEMMRNLRQGHTANTKQSKLTQLLAGAMGLGASATARSEILMLTTVNLSGEHIGKSLRTLNFAQTVGS